MDEISSFSEEQEFEHLLEFANVKLLDPKTRESFALC